MRINRYLSEKGGCSRREADKMIQEGRVRIAGRIAVLGDIVLEGQKVLLDGKVLGTAPKKCYLAFNKPAGITCTTDLRVKDNIISFIGYPERIFPIGRLDKDSEGLILLTNDGDIVNRVLRAENEHQKEYHVKLNKNVSDAQLQSLLDGVEIFNPEKNEQVFVHAKAVSRLGDAEASITLTQGLNRQVRRMFEAVGLKVIRLLRVRIMHIKLGKLKPGYYRELSKAEVAGLWGRRREGEAREEKGPGNESQE